jgi:hypothetical protein
MASDIDMSSNALLLIGDNAISSFTEPGFGAKVASNLYPDTYAAILASHPWSFALKEQFLNQLSQTPESITGYQFAYQMPTDLIRIWELMDHSDYVIVGDLIYSNQSKILLRYIFKVAESALPAHVVKAIEYKLAAEFSISITENQSMAALYEKKYLLQLGQAQAIDSQNRPQSGIVDSPIVDVRFGGRGARY